VHRIAEDAEVVFVSCQRCGTQTEHYEDAYAPRGEAIAAWNKRTPSERQAIVDWLLSMKRDDTNWPQHLAKRIERGEHLGAPSHE